MKTFVEFIKEADVPTNVTGSAVSTNQPVVRKKATINTNKIMNSLLNVIIKRRLKSVSI